LNIDVAVNEMWDRGIHADCDFIFALKQCDVTMKLYESVPDETGSFLSFLSAH